MNVNALQFEASHATVQTGAAPMVLHVRVVRGSGGGPDKTVLRSAGYAERMGVRMAAVYLHPHDDPGMAVIRAQAKMSGCELYEIGESGPIDPWAVRGLIQLCRKLRVGVWHAHDYKSDALGLLIRRFWPMRLVTTVHGWTRETSRTKLYYHVDNWCLPRYDSVLAVSPLLLEHCRAHGVPSDRLRYVPNAIEPGEYIRTRSCLEAKRELGVSTDDGAVALGVVSRFSPEKGVDRAIRLLDALRRRLHLNTHLHLVGDGPQRPVLERLVDSLDLRRCVHFHGWQSETKPYFEAMDALFLPSYTEGLPNVVLEAMAMNVPVAATDVGGVRDLLDDGEAGVIVNQDESTWPAAVAPLLTSASAREQFASAGRHRVETRFSFGNRMKMIGRVYHDVLSLPIRRRHTGRQAA